MSTSHQIGPQGLPGVPSQAHFPAEYSESRWYAAYTLSRHEKQVARQLEERQLDCFLPLYRSIHRWKDRRKQVELALFPGYVFVHIALKDRLQVLQLPSVVQFVTFNGKPAAVPESEIEASRRWHNRLAAGAPLRRSRTLSPLAGAAEGYFQGTQHVGRISASPSRQAARANSPGRCGSFI